MFVFGFVNSVVVSFDFFWMAFSPPFYVGFTLLSKEGRRASSLSVRCGKGKGGVWVGSVLFPG